MIFGFSLLVYIGFAALIVLVVSRLNSLGFRITILEREIDKLRSSKTPSPAVSAQAPAAPAQVSPVIMTSPPPPAPVQPPRSNAEAPGIFAPPPSSSPSRTREEWETFVGGKLLNRIGALALVFGVAFFLKYAFDNNWITESMRVLIGLVAGCGVLFLGIRSHKKGLQVFAQGLFGAGISILYLSMYASFGYYHLVSQLTAFLLMTGVTASAFTIALTYDSLAISLLAWAGGFSTPFLLSTGEANEPGLFSYVAFLQAGILAIASRKRTWIVLEVLTLVSVFGIFFLWYSDYYSESALGLTVFFLTLFWGLFFAAEVSNAMRADRVQPELRQVIGAFNALLFYLFLYGMIDTSHHEWMGAVTLAISVVYLAYGLQIARRDDTPPGLLAQNLLTSVFLLAVATVVQWKGYTAVILLSMEAAALVWCGVRWNFRAILLAAGGMFLFASLKLFTTAGAFAFRPLSEFTILLNYRALAFTVLAGSLGLGVVPLRGNEERAGSTMRNILHCSWTCLLFLFIVIEVNDFFSQQGAGMDGSGLSGVMYAKFMTLICCWTVYSVVLVAGSLRTSTFPVLVAGLVIMAIAMLMSFIRGIEFLPAETFRPVVNLRMLALTVVLTGAYLNGTMLKDREPSFSWIRDVRGFISVASVVLLLWLLTGETRDIFQWRAFVLTGEAELLSNENLKQLSLSGLWLGYGIALMIIGIWRRVRGIRILAIILLGVSILKIFGYDLSFLQTLYRIFSFMALGVILLAASYLYQRYKSQIVA